jgi:hypothetical protein
LQALGKTEGHVYEKLIVQIEVQIEIIFGKFLSPRHGAGYHVAAADHALGFGRRLYAGGKY